MSPVVLTGMGQPASTASAQVLLSGARCEPNVRARLGEWHAALDRSLAEPLDPTGVRSVRVPTPRIGSWIRLVRDAHGELAIERITAREVHVYRFGPTCETEGGAAVASLPTPLVPGAWGDEELVARVARGDRGVFLLWSPHMPLSVDQHAVLEGVARELGLAVEPLLDPGADAGYAARIARARRLPAGATRPLGGIELAFRGMTTHTPSLQLFAGGRLIGPVLYGYRSAEPLRAALEEALAGR